MRKQARRAGLPVRFADHVPDRDLVARLLATADIALAPGPVETFGLAALEALAGGTPVVVSADSALPEVVGDAGRAVAGGGSDYAEAILELAVRPRAERRAAARRRAERFPWSASVAGFLRAHGVEPPPCEGAGSLDASRPRPGTSGHQYSLSSRIRFAVDPVSGFW